MEENKAFENAYKTLLPMMAARGFRERDILDEAYRSREPKRMRELVWNEVSALLDIYRTI